MPEPKDYLVCGLSTSDMVGIAQRAIKDLHSRCHTKDKRIADLEAEVAILRKWQRDFLDLQIVSGK